MRQGGASGAAATARATTCTAWSAAAGGGGGGNGAGTCGSAAGAAVKAGLLLLLLVVRRQAWRQVCNGGRLTLSALHGHWHLLAQLQQPLRLGRVALTTTSSSRPRRRRRCKHVSRGGGGGRGSRAWARCNKHTVSLWSWQRHTHLLLGPLPFTVNVAVSGPSFSVRTASPCRRTPVLAQTNHHP